MFLSVVGESVLKAISRKLINRLAGVGAVLLLSTPVMAMKYRILSDRLIEVGKIDELSESSTSVTFIPSGLPDVVAEPVLIADDDQNGAGNNEMIISLWQLIQIIQSGSVLNKKFILASSFLTGQSLYLEESVSRDENHIHGFRLSNQDKSQLWDILILAKKDVRRLLGKRKIIRTILIFVNGKIVNIIVPEASTKEIHPCVSK